MIVIVEFPNLEQARAWYRSPEYAFALEMHDKALSRNLILGARSAASQSRCIHSRPTQSNHESPRSCVGSSKDGGKNAEKVA
jgi:hypothetical protein